VAHHAEAQQPFSNSSPDVKLRDIDGIWVGMEPGLNRSGKSLALQVSRMQRPTLKISCIVSKPRATNSPAGFMLKFAGQLVGDLNYSLAHVPSPCRRFDRVGGGMLRRPDRKGLTLILIERLFHRCDRQIFYRGEI